MDDIKEKIKQALRHIWTNKYRLFLCLLTLCCLFGLVHYFKSADSATASISFNYSEAALGMNPNKTRFNAYEIVSDEVMERAIRRVGLQDSLTASQLAQCLYLSPEGTGSANGSEYISTNYYLSINTRKLELGSRKPMDLLQSVCESYREIFQSSYCDNQSLLKEKLEVTTDCEPYLRLNELEVRAEGLNRYLNTRLQENKSFTDDANPDSSTNNFTTMGKKINNLVDYDLPNAMAFVIEGGVARDPAMLSSILEYKNKIDSISYRKSMAYYDASKNGISLYEKSMTSVVMIPTTDELSEYYMSRTKTAMDTMARNADTCLSDATEYQSDIVSRWERGLGFPDIQTIEPLAQALGISVLELMRSERQEKAKEEAAPEIQYTQKEVAEMLQNAGDISRQQKKQDRNANVIAGFLVIGVAAAAWAAKIVNVGGGLILGGLVAAAFVSLWYFFQNLDDEESRKVYGAASILSIGILASLVNFVWGDQLAEFIPGGLERKEQIFWTLWYLFVLVMMMIGTIRCIRRQRQKKEKKYKTVLFTAIMATIMFVTLWQYQNTMQNRYKNTGIWRGAQQYAEVLLKRNKNLENDWLIGDESWREGNKNTFEIRLTYYADADDAKEGRESEYQYKIHFDDVDGYVIKSEGVPEKEIVFPENK